MLQSRPDMFFTVLCVLLISLGTVLSFSAGNQSAGVEIVVTDKDGKVLIRHTPELNYAVGILSTPDLVSGETYTVTIGSASGTVTAK